MLVVLLQVCLASPLQDFHQARLLTSVYLHLDFPHQETKATSLCPQVILLHMPQVIPPDMLQGLESLLDLLDLLDPEVPFLYQISANLPRDSLHLGSCRLLLTKLISCPLYPTLSSLLV